MMYIVPIALLIFLAALMIFTGYLTFDKEDEVRCHACFAVLPEGHTGNLCDSCSEFYSTAEALDAEAERLDKEPTRTCKVCKVDKPLSSFQLVKGRGEGKIYHRHVCKVCTNERRRNARVSK